MHKILYTADILFQQNIHNLYEYNFSKNAVFYRI